MRRNRLFERLALALFIGGILVHMMFLLSLKQGWLNPLFNDSVHRFGPGGDFFSIYAAGVKARLGASIYTVGGHVEQAPYAYAFRYAPLVAYTLGWILSLFPALSAYALWLILCELTLLRNLRLTLEYSKDARIGYVAAALWLLFSPYYLELYVGQFTFITASLVFWAYLAWEPVTPQTSSTAGNITNAGKSSDPVANSRRTRLCGDLFFILAVWLKLMPLLYLPIALLRGRWKGVLTALGVLAVTSLIYFAHFPGDWAVFREINGSPLPTWHAGNQGLMAYLYTFVGERPAEFYRARLATLMMVGAVLSWLTYRLWQQVRIQKKTVSSSHPTLGSAVPNSMIDPALDLYAACSAAYLLTYKDVWEHHYILLLPPIVLYCLRRTPVLLWLPSFLIAALPTVFVLYDVRGLGYNEDPQRYWQGGISLLHHAWKPIAPLWLFVGITLRSLPWRRSVSKKSESRLIGNDFGMRRVTIASFALIIAVGIFFAAHWASAQIVAQHKLTRQLSWPETIFHKQERQETCGPAALASVCRYYGVSATEAEIAGLAGTTPGGTTMLGLRQAAQAKGLSAEGRLSDVHSLPSLPRPCILYFRPGHFAVLTGVQGDNFYVADPSLGRRVWTSAQLDHFWNGEVLLVGPSDSRQ